MVCTALASCGSSKLTTTCVGYQSVRTRHAQPTKNNPIPESAKIAVAYTISPYGDITAIVYNRTSEIMTIDQTKSFFVSPNGKSTSYYDPTVRTTSTTDMSSVTKGGSINLGSIAGALGIGGTIGQIASGINLGGSGTKGEAITNSTYVADMPQVSLAPYSNGAMSKSFNVSGLGCNYLKGNTVLNGSLTEDQSYSRFSVCISYSVDNGKTFDKIVTDFYANSKVIIPITKTGRVNEALQEIYKTKPDAINEYWWLLNFNSNITSPLNHRHQGILYDYK